MDLVTEIIDAIPENESSVELSRREDLLLSVPPPAAMKFWRDHDLLPIVHFDLHYTPRKFAPPRDIFSSDVFRLEWQLMNGRQPFYHRNADVDEISFQACGERTLMTELGTVELRPGDFSRIPVSVAHDNYGREDVHLLFYTLAPAVECGQVERSAEHKKVPFQGWTPAPRVAELMTECLGTPGCDISVSLVDEQLLLDEGNGHARSGGRISVQRARGGASESVTEWLYKSKWVWMGAVRLDMAAGTVYRRHRRANAIHCQIQGSRTIVTQRGTAKLEPGDFISIPRGCAYTSVTSCESFHIVILSMGDVDLKAEVARRAEPTSLERVNKAREEKKE